MSYQEKDFESIIEQSLLENGGYAKGDVSKFNKSIAINEESFIKFIQETQSDEWIKYVRIYGNDSNTTIVKRVIKEINDNGIIKVLRQGFTDRGVKFKLCYFKPETSINIKSSDNYNKNILECVRQLHYSNLNNNNLDIALFLNGFPIITLELKNQFTGQTTSNARNQYIIDRNPNDPIFEFGTRSLVHFAVDLTDCYMATKLAGSSTYFLPFNQGSNGAGNVGGKGNPINPNGFPTSYLWEKVLKKDTLMEIIHKYIHIEVPKDKTYKEGKIIFPRYHQLDVVTKLLDDVKQNGAGKNYLIQHSAGSGKSNSIAWLSHRLSSLHDNKDNKIFSSVIVVTDRKVLDNQLQDTIYQFDHVLGVVEKIDGKSTQLRDAINNGKKIIITTLQKFPVIYKDINGTDNNFAIIVDEAHSSQTGQAAKKLKHALANTDKVLEEYAKYESEIEESTLDEEDKLVQELASQGNHDNLSFFAFTATPKDKTLQMFGEKQQDGTFKAYHTYSMQQAIEEGFIIDILKNYMTYNMYYQIVKTGTENPEINSSKGMKAIARFESLHPHNLSQKTAIMIEQFLEITNKKIGGRAKAMVVTSSRLHAVRYLKEFKTYIKKHKLTDLDVLVAFSGVIDDDGIEYTEEKLNKDKEGNSIKEKQLPKRFNEDFNVLIVAEKYQTGFDEPLLHTMFVDKKLSGVKAVQTLSRLNRTCVGKNDTFILDFVNTAEDIQKSFEPYYKATILEKETDPNVIYDLKNRLETYLVWHHVEVKEFCKQFYRGDIDEKSMQKLLPILQPAVDRYNVLEKEKQQLFKTLLASFVRIYSFITGVYRMMDKETHSTYLFVKFLSAILPKEDKDIVDLGDNISLEYYKLQKSYEGSIILSGDEGLGNITGDLGIRKEKKETLSEIISKVNEKFGTEFTNMDKLLEQFTNDMCDDERLISYAKNNTRDEFKHLYRKEFENVAVKRFEQNNNMFSKMFDEQGYMEYLMDEMLPYIYKKLRNK